MLSNRHQKLALLLSVPALTLAWGLGHELAPGSLQEPTLVFTLALAGGSVSAILALLFAADALRARALCDRLRGRRPVILRVRRRPADERRAARQAADDAETAAECPVCAEADADSTEADADSTAAEGARREPEAPVTDQGSAAASDDSTTRSPIVTSPMDKARLRQIRHLKRQIDILSAMRNLSLIANDEVDFKGILERALLVIEGLFEASEIQVYLKHEKAPDPLYLAAVRRKNETTFAEPDGERLRGAHRKAQEAIESRRGFRRLTSNRLMVVTVLWADQEAIGVIAVFTPRRERDEVWADEMYTDLAQLTKHVALVIRKPTLYDRAVLDGLTGLYSKRHFLEQVPKAMSAARRLGTPLSLIVIDIDHFKSINDTHGHVSGDIVLAEVAAILRRSVRDYDTVYRFGGEEMCVVAPNCDLEAAFKLAERIREAIAEKPFIGDKDQEIPVAASFGMAAWDASMASCGDFTAAADKWLYRAKEEGRNQVRPNVEEIRELSPEPDESGVLAAA